MSINCGASKRSFRGNVQHRGGQVSVMALCTVEEFNLTSRIKVTAEIWGVSEASLKLPSTLLCVKRCTAEHCQSALIDLILECTLQKQPSGLLCKQYMEMQQIPHMQVIGQLFIIHKRLTQTHMQTHVHIYMWAHSQHMHPLSVSNFAHHCLWNASIDWTLLTMQR